MAPAIHRQQTEAALVGFHRLGSTPNQVVHCGTRRIATAGDLRKRPVAPQIELEDIALLLRQQRRITLEQLYLALS